MNLSREISERWACVLNEEFETRGLSLKAEARQKPKAHATYNTGPAPWIVRINRWQKVSRIGDMAQPDPAHQPVAWETYLSLGSTQEAIAFRLGLQANASCRVELFVPEAGEHPHAEHLG